MRLRAIAVAAAVACTAVFAGIIGPAATVHAQQTTNKNNTVSVQPGDTLTKIAQAHGTTYVRLYSANDHITDPDLIYVGQTIRIPAADEQLADRPLPDDQTAPTNQQPASTAAATANNTVWDRLAQCESSGNWSINTGNGFYGGLQFTLSSWQLVGGSGYPHQASREEQIMRAEKLLAIQGWNAWPACSAKLGLR